MVCELKNSGNQDDPITAGHRSRATLVLELCVRVKAQRVSDGGALNKLSAQTMIKAWLYRQERLSASWRVQQVPADPVGGHEASVTGEWGFNLQRELMA